jgi:hypothetical protein
MCKNSACKSYYEDCCIKNINSEFIKLDKDGTCELFEYGRNDMYSEEYNMSEKW